MAIKLEEMFNEIRYPSVITTAKGFTISGALTATGAVDLSGSTAVTLPATTVTGAQTTIKKTYSNIAVSTAGSAVAVTVFGSTAPVAGTVTGFYVSALGTVTAGTATLWGTTAGTISSVAFGTTVGTFSGSTSVLNSAVVAGDTFTVTSNSNGTVTCYVVFQSAS